MPIFDAHSHAFPDAVAPGAMKTLVAEARWISVQNHHDGTLAGLVGSMDHAGVDRAIMCSVATRTTQVRKITDWSASIVSDRIVPFASIHPDYEAPEEEVERIAQFKIRGLKFHPQYMRCPADDPRVLRIARAAAKAKLAMVFHAGYDLAFDRDDLASPRRLRALHDAVPDLRLMACHMGGWHCWEESLEYLAGQSVWLETSYSLSHCSEEMLYRLIEKHSPDHLLWGSDSPWAEQGEDLRRFQSLSLSDDLKQRATWTNAHQFLGIDAIA